MNVLPSGCGEVHLPHQVLVQVFQHLPLHECLSSFSFVSRSWRSAANAATCKLHVGFKPENERHKSFQAWLLHHGQHLTQLELDIWAAHYEDAWAWTFKRRPGSMDQLHLPVQTLHNLRQLSLDHVQLLPMNVPADSSHTSPPAAAAAAAGVQCSATSSPLSALISLTHLQLHHAACCSCNLGICCLPAFTNLQHLELRGSKQPEGIMAVEQFEAYCGAVIAQLTQLTHLELGLCDIGDAALAELSSLQNLQCLTLVSGRHSTDCLAALPSKLVSLFIDVETATSSDRSVLIRYPNLAALQHLSLTAKQAVDATVACSLTQLTHLNIESGEGSHKVVHQLMRALPGLQQLRHLRVQNCIHDQQLKALALEAVSHMCIEEKLQLSSLLFASRQLTYVDLKGVVLPAASGRYMFPTNKHAPQLRVLLLHFDNLPAAREQCQPLGAGDIARLASCCPWLQQLQLTGAVQPGVNISAVTQLTGLTGLAITGDAVDDSAAEAALAHLTSLQELTVEGSPKFTDNGLCHLTTLTQLTALRISACGLQEGNAHGANCSLNVDLPERTADSYYGCDPVVDGASRTKGPALPVWQQLYKLCIERHHRCLEVLQQRQHQLSEAKAGIQQQLQLQVVALEQQLAAVQAQAAEHQQQMAQAQAALALYQQQQQ